MNGNKVFTCAINLRKYSIHQLHPQDGTMDLLPPPSAVEVFISLASFRITWTSIQQHMDMLLLSNKAKRARSRNFVSYGFIVLIGSPSPVSRSLSSSNLTLILLLFWFCSVTRHRAHTPLLAFFSEARVLSWTWIRESQGGCSKGWEAVNLRAGTWLGASRWQLKWHKSQKLKAGSSNIEGMAVRREASKLRCQKWGINQVARNLLVWVSSALEVD